MPAQQKRRIVTFGLASLGAAALAACSPVKLLNATIPSSGYRRTSGIAYGSDPRQVLDVYVPAAASTQPRPVVVFFYGGSWQTRGAHLEAFPHHPLTSRGYGLARG